MSQYYYGDLIDTIELEEFTMELYRRDLSLFSGEFSKYFCTIIIKNKIGVVIASIKTSDVEIVNLLDNIYFYLETKNDTMYSFAMDDQSVYYTVSLNTYIPYIDGIMDSTLNVKHYMTFFATRFTLVDSNMKTLCRLDVTNKIEEICNKLYNAYVASSDMEYNTIYAMNPIYHFNNALVEN